MAGNPSAVASLTGSVRIIDRFDTKPDTTTGEVRQAARVTLLTEPNGGFAEVYVGADDQGALDHLDVGGTVCWRVTVRAGNRSWERKDGSTAAFPQLWLRFVPAADSAALSLPEPESLRRRPEAVAS